MGWFSTPPTEETFSDHPPIKIDVIYNMNMGDNDCDSGLEDFPSGGGKKPNNERKEPKRGGMDKKPGIPLQTNNVSEGDISSVKNVSFQLDNDAKFYPTSSKGIQEGEGGGFESSKLIKRSSVVHLIKEFSETNRKIRSSISQFVGRVRWSGLGFSSYFYPPW